VTKSKPKINEQQICAKIAEQAEQSAQVAQPIQKVPTMETFAQLWQVQ